jgi:hypothetical protein
MRKSLFRSLLSPAGLIAIAALIVSMSGTAYAVATITGADIKNGTVTTRDIKNNSLTGRDIRNGSLSTRDLNLASNVAISQTGVRAVAGFGGIGTCAVTTSQSRGFYSTCTRPSAGHYTLHLTQFVDSTLTVAACGLEYSGGFNSTYDYSCTARVNSDRTVEVVLSAHDDTTTSSRVALDGLNLYVVVF